MVGEVRVLCCFFDYQLCSPWSANDFVCILGEEAIEFASGKILEISKKKSSLACD